MKGKKKALVVILCLVLALSGVFFATLGNGDVMAATLAEDGSYVALPYNEVNAESDIPVPTDDAYTGWIFAGWFSNAECTAATSAGSTSYAKFVTPGVLNTKAQIATVKEDDAYIIRFISTVESLNYAQVGFEVTYEGAENPMYGYTDTVYERIDSTSESVKYEFNPKVVNTKSEYFVTAKLKVTDEAKDYTVRAFWDTLSGQRVYGAERCVSVNDGKATTPVNVSFEMKDGVTVAESDNLSVTYGSKTGTVEVIGVDGATVHTRVTLASGDTKEGLTSATKFVFKKGSDEVGSEIHRNLYTKYTGGKTYDKTWYTVDESADEFMIATSADLYGMAEIFNTDKKRDSFTDKTIMLGASININEGTATEDGWVPAEGASTYRWTAIGKDTNYTRFSGTFDGQGETISGVVVIDDSNTTAAEYQGLFGITHNNSMLKNFRLENSYFESTAAGGWSTDGNSYALMGSVAGQLLGSMDTVYSNAIVVSENLHAGGVVGRSYASAADSINNCWFDGSVIVSTDTAKDMRVGGILGQHVSGKNTIKNCLNTGKIQYTFTTDADVAVNVGGIFGGASTSTTVSNCLNTGDVIVQTAAGVAHTKGVDAITATSGAIKTANFATAESNATVNSNATSVAETNITGYTSYNYVKELGFCTSANPEGLWTVRANDVPALKSFVEDGIDVAWYYEAEGDFVIKTAEEMYGFSAVAKKNSFSGKTIKLANDIKLNSGDAHGWGKKAPARAWEPIGISSCNFAGTFDGQGYTINGAYFKCAENYVGLFGLATEKSVIKDVALTNSYFENNGSGYYGMGSIAGQTYGIIDTVYSDAILVSDGLQIGGIVGRMNATDDGGATVNNCWYTGTIYMNDNAFQGGGIVGNMIQKYATITNCLFDGMITSERASGDASIGGIAGVQANPTLVTMTGCLSAGRIYAETGATNVGSVFGSVKNNASTFNLAGVYATTECFGVTHVLGGTSVTVNGAIETYSEENIIGEKAFNLYGLDYSNYWVAWSHTPRLMSFWTAEFTPSATQPHTGWYNAKATEMTIMTVADMYGFTTLSASDNFSGKIVKLGADIILNEGNAADWANKAPKNKWTPIGRSKTFAGTFDGQGHTISGMYVSETQNGAGLFRDTSVTSSIKNLRLENSYITSTNSIVGAIAGWGYGAIDSVYTDAIIKVSNNVNTVGGLVGAKNNGANTIRNCWFDGEIYTGTSGWYIGGIIGYVTNSGSQTVVENCLYTGVIESTRTLAPYLGGICGNMQDGSPKLTINKCLVAGEINVANSQYVGDIVGYIKTGTAVYNSVYTVTTDYPDTGYGTATGSSISYDKTAISGEGAFKMDGLDFEDVWVAKEGKTPELRTFSSADGQIEIPDTLPDTSWYNTTDTEFVIKTVRQMYGFSEISRTIDNFQGKTVKLGADIVFNEGEAKDWASKAPKNEWIPIGKGKTFKGHIDGQGHTISGMYVNATYNGAGLVSDASLDTSFKDFRIVNSYIRTTNAIAGSVAGWGYGAMDSIYSNAIIETSNGTVGGLVGAKNNGDNTISNCWFDGEIKAGSSGTYYGGIVGYAANSGSKTTVENCLFTGKITSANTGAVYLGGIWGALYTGSPTLTVKSCLVAGEFDVASSERVGDVIGSISSGTVTLNSVYTLSNSYKDSGIGGTSGSSTSFEKTDICGEGAFQMTGLDFVNYWVAKEGKTPELQTFTSSSGSINTNKMTADTSWYNTTDTTFTIDTVAELYGLAQLSSNNDFAGKTIKLGKDLSLNEGNAKDWKTTAPLNTWTSMGSFAGTFDGQGHSISGLYINSTSANTGFFSQTTSTSTVKNLWITNSYIKSTKANVGSVAGTGLGIFDTIYSNAIIDVELYYIGGIVGYVSSGTDNVIKNCWFNGRINGVAQAGYYIGGILGCIENTTTVTMENCLNSGKITSIRTDRPVLGGLCGSAYHAGSKLIVKNSLFTGYFDSVNQYTIGTTVGYVPNGSIEITNVYGVDEGNPANGANGAVNNGKFTGTTTLVTRDNLTGKLAKIYLAEFDFETTWTTVDGATPILQAFSNYKSEGVTGMLLGNSIAKYSIVIADDATTLTKMLAEHFQGLLFDETGVMLNIVTDAAEDAGYEIILGDTNRTISSLVYTNGEYNNSDYSYSIKSSGSSVAFGYTDSTALISAWKKFAVLLGTDTSAGIDAKGTDETVTGIAKADSSYVRVMSSNVYNMKDTSFDALGMPWDARAEIMAEVYKVYKPDFIGLQEAHADQQTEILKYISDMYAIVQFPEASTNWTPLLYRKDLYKVDAKYYYDFTGGRHLEWALYSSIANADEKFIHMNLHYSPYQDQQHDHAVIVNNEIKRVMALYPNVPIAVTGDYNNSALSDTFITMTAGINMVSGAAQIGNTDSTYYTWHRLGQETLSTSYSDGTVGPIDIVAITTDFIEAKAYKMIHDPIVCWGADHYPVFLDVKGK